MTTLENDTLIRALLRQPTPYTPVWLMRQAGRYLPEYNATRARAGDFLSLCKTPALATEVTLQPLARFPLDAAILFSDILTIPDAMGLGLSFAEGAGGPRFARPVRDERAIGRLAVPDPHGELRYVVDAVAEIRRALRGRMPLIGFAGSPFTLACYMIEGGSSDDFRTVKQMLYQRPELLHRLLDVNARAVAAYLNAQIEAGADAVMVFDTWGGTLAHAAYLEFSLAYTTRVVAALLRERDAEDRHRGVPETKAKSRKTALTDSLTMANRGCAQFLWIKVWVTFSLSCNPPSRANQSPPHAPVLGSLSFTDQRVASIHRTTPHDRPCGIPRHAFVNKSSLGTGCALRD